MSAKVENAPRNRRLDPELRKKIILDKTAELIAAEGVSAVSMERIGHEAGVSKALVYTYFKNQTNLLQELLLREQRTLGDNQAIALSQASNFDELIRLTTRTYLKHVEENGLHIQRLMNEPAVAAAYLKADQREHQMAVDLISSEMVRNFGIPASIAELATELSMGMTGAAGNLINRGAVSREKIEEINLVLLESAMAALRDNYAKKS